MHLEEERIALILDFVGEQLNVPRGTKYELCRSVHSGTNAIISAARRDMIGSTLYLVGKDKNWGTSRER